jgi:hypothetical protein
MIRQLACAINLHAIGLLLIFAVVGLPRLAAAADSSEQGDDPRIVEKLVDANFAKRRHNGAQVLAFRKEALTVAEEIYPQGDSRIIALRKLVQSAERAVNWSPQDWRDGEELDEL